MIEIIMNLIKGNNYSQTQYLMQYILNFRGRGQIKNFYVCLTEVNFQLIADQSMRKTSLFSASFQW
jgi:hypothetical protein